MSYSYNMNIYLDIDGVLLANEKNASRHLYKFIDYLVSNHDVYWLTTHCKGDAKYTLQHLSRVLTEDIISLLRAVKPTTWDNNKTEAIDFSKPFVWFDDELYPGEQEDLDQYGAQNSWYEIDLSENEDQLLEALQFVKSFSTYSNNTE